MLNFFKKRNVVSLNDDSKFEIELIGSVLAYEIARSDGDIDKEELDLILKQIKKTSLEISKDEDEILNIIKTYHENSVSFNEFINDINIEFSYDEKLELIKFLWEVAYADNLLEVNEERLIRRIADLIKLKDIKVLKLKNDAKNKI
tara:strand:+ start:1290 stop:1727 length:438 start_codon:yes stop_codon:yes gene_type:complete